MQDIVYQNNTFLNIIICIFVILELLNSEFCGKYTVEVFIIKVKDDEMVEKKKKKNVCVNSLEQLQLPVCSCFWRKFSFFFLRL